MQSHRIVGLNQGILPVTTDPKIGENLVNHPDPIRGVKWVDNDGDPVPAEAPAA
jgi:hypothetical protein